MQHASPVIYRVLPAATLFGLIVISPAQAAVVEDHPNSAGCPLGTFAVPASNNVKNSSFNTLNGGPAAAGELVTNAFTASIPYIGDNMNVPDTQMSIQTGAVNYIDRVVQEPFPGDEINVVPATENYLYINGNNTAPDGNGDSPPYAPWIQTLNVEASTTYTFVMYASNMLVPGFSTTVEDPGDPILQLKIDNEPVGLLYTLDEAIEADGIDRWQRIEQQFMTEPSQTSLVLSIEDQQARQFGNDYGITSMGLFRCETPSDSDGDGIFDDVDLDDDNDGIPDQVEGPGDADGDSIPNYQDLDSDGDGDTDLEESGLDAAALDADADGVIDANNPVGSNGLVDDLESSADSGNLNYTPTDIDGDGIADANDTVDDRPKDNDGGGGVMAPWLMAVLFTGLLRRRKLL